jgi:hypothetical protein
MPNVQDAILAIRSAVQDLGDSETTLGGPAPLHEVRWVGKLLGFEWPQAYLDLIAKHDGVRVRGAELLDFYRAFRLFVAHREPWHRLAFWPVAADGCGDYWVLPLRERKEGDCPVYFLDHETEAGMSAPTKVAASSVAAFVIDYMTGFWVQEPDDGEEEPPG